MVDFDRAHEIFRISHAAIGMTGLALFWIPVLARKGSRLHIRCGRLFVWCVWYVGVTGLLASVWGVVHPASFLSVDELARLDEQKRRLALEGVRFILSITGFLALAVLGGALLGVRAVRTKEHHERLKSPLLLALEVSLGVWSAALAIYGAASLVACYAGWHFLPAGAGHRYWINIVLGAYGLYGALAELKYIYGSRPEPMTWWTLHMECMLGSGAGFHAAFFLFGAGRILPLEGAWRLLAPITPLVIGHIATTWWTRRYERKFARQASQDEPAATGFADAPLGSARIGGEP